MSFDERCYDLAEYFLNCGKNSAPMIDELAQEIQDTIENFIERESLKKQAIPE